MPHHTATYPTATASCPTAPTDPTDTATEISALYAQLPYGRGRQRFDPRAVRIGELLTLQKHRLPHGDFLPWLRRCCPFGYATTRKLMRDYRHITPPALAITPPALAPDNAPPETPIPPAIPETPAPTPIVAGRRRRVDPDELADRERRKRDRVEPLDDTRRRIARHLDERGPTPGGDVCEQLGISREKFWRAVSNDGGCRAQGFELTFGTPAGWTLTEKGRHRWLGESATTGGDHEKRRRRKWLGYRKPKAA